MALSITKYEGTPTAVCIDCGEPPTKIIDGIAYCAHCGDNLLIKTIKKCIERIEEARVILNIMPKGVINAQKKGGNET